MQTITFISVTGYFSQKQNKKKRKRRGRGRRKKEEEREEEEEEEDHYITMEGLLTAMPWAVL